MKMTGRQQLFAQEYLVDLNGLQAALRAGYPPKSARRNSTRLLKHPAVKEFIEKKQAERLGKIELNAETILRELLSLATVDLRLAFNEDGSLKDVAEIPENVARAIASVDVDEIFEWDGEKKNHIGYTRKVKFWDKNKSLELLARHLSLLNDKVEVNHNFNFAEKIKAARERARDALRAAHNNLN